MATRRRKLEPRRLRQPRALRRFSLLALLAALVGAAIVWAILWLLRRYPGDPQEPSLLRLAPAFVIVLTFFTVVALLFFGIRAYLSGAPGRRPLQQSRPRFRSHR